jgi:hypothetical protein
MESEFTKIIYAKNNGIPWQSQIAKFVSRQKNRLYGNRHCGVITDDLEKKVIGSAGLSWVIWRKGNRNCRAIIGDPEKRVTETVGLSWVIWRKGNRNCWVITDGPEFSNL